MPTLASSVAPLPARVRPAGAHDRLFYGGMAVALALTVLSGFAGTYYLRLLSGGPTATITGGPFTTLVHVHAAIYTAWMLLFVVQTALISGRRVAVHRRLGVAGAVLAAAMIGVGALVAIATAARGAAPPGMTPFGFLVIPLFDVVIFGAFVTLALVKRRDKETHKRLMLLAYITIITAAIARLPGVLPLGPPAFFGLSFIFIIAGVIYDAVSRRRVHKAYLWGWAAIVISIPLRLAIAHTAAWETVARGLTGLVSR